MSDKANDALEKPVRKRQQRSIITQHKLLDAATDAFSENGYKGTSTRDIAERAGVHHPLITYHFKNKNLLWRAAADRCFQSFSESMRAVLAERAAYPLVDQAKAYIHHFVRYAHGNPALHKIIWQESGQPSDRLDWLVEQHLKPFYEELLPMLNELQAQGIAPPGNPSLLYNMIRVSTGGLLALSLEIRQSSGMDFDEDGALNDLAEMIIRCFLPGAEA